MPKAIKVDLHQVRLLAGMKATQGEIARFFQMTRRTFERKLASDKDLRAALDYGHGEADLNLRRKQWQMAVDKGSIPMLIFLGKNNLGQRDTFTQEHSGPNGKPISVQDATSAKDRLASILDRIAQRQVEAKGTSETD